jgi:hypothetical protein
MPASRLGRMRFGRFGGDKYTLIVVVRKKKQDFLPEEIGDKNHQYSKICLII